jgi:GxxExxY protein
MTNSHLPSAIIGAAIEVHKTLGRVLRESAYEQCVSRSVPFEGQKPVPVVYKDVKLDCYRLDFRVAHTVMVERKSIETMAPIKPLPLRICGFPAVGLDYC